MSGKVLRFPDGSEEPPRPKRFVVSIGEWIREALAGDPSQRPKLVSSQGKPTGSRNNRPRTDDSQ